MVLTTTIRQMATKRVPLIKFRRQREDEAATLRTGSMGTGDLKPKSSSPAAVNRNYYDELMTNVTLILVLIHYCRQLAYRP